MAKTNTIKYGQTLHIKKKLQCEILRWGICLIGAGHISPGYYDVIQVKKNKVLLAWNLSGDGWRFQPSSKYQYWVAKKLLIGSKVWILNEAKTGGK